MEFISPLTCEYGTYEIYLFHFTIVADFLYHPKSVSEIRSINHNRVYSCIIISREDKGKIILVLPN